MASIKQQMQMVNKLLKLKRFDEARDVLMTIDHKKAKQMLKAVNKKAPEKDAYVEEDDEDDLVMAAPAGSPNLVFIFTSLLVIITIISGGVFAASEPVDLLEEMVDEDGCSAQRWFRDATGTFADVTSFSPYALIDLEAIDPELVTFDVDPELQQKLIDRYQRRIDRLNAVDTPECAEQAKTYLLAALEATKSAAEKFNVQNPIGSFTQMGVMLDNSIAAAKELQALDVRFAGQDLFAVAKLTNADCPAYEWAMRQMYSDNQFMLMIMVLDDIWEGANIYEAALNYIRSLRQQQYRLEDAPAPPCVHQAKVHLVSTIDSYAMMFEAATGNDTYGIDFHYENSLDTFELFFAELEALDLDPQQFGRWFVLGY